MGGRGSVGAGPESCCREEARRRASSNCCCVGGGVPCFVGRGEGDKRTDLAVRSQDIFAVPVETIGKSRVVTTMVGGKIVYGATP